MLGLQGFALRTRIHSRTFEKPRRHNRRAGDSRTGRHDATAKQLHGRTTPKSVGEFAFGLCHVDNKLDSLPQALPKRFDELIKRYLYIQFASI